MPDNRAAMRTDTLRSPEGNDPVLVSIVVRSMGRPELRATLESIARQDHASLEIVIVDATGGRHPPLPEVGWSPGHVVRLVSNGVPLKRPQAAMLGLTSMRGDWVMFLDDDDTCEPTHVSSLVDAVARHPDALLVYGCGRLHDEQGRLQQVFGRPFNRALMHYGPLFYWQSAIISQRVRGLGCGFDPALEVCEDRDFLAQIAEHGDFVFERSIATFNYRPDLGTSGTGQGANRNAVRVARYENLLRAKWAGSGVYHNERVATWCRQGVRAFFDADLERSRRAFETALSAYPDDPNALHGLARVDHALGDQVAAERHVRRAIEINPLAAEYHATLNEIVAASGASVSGKVARPPSRTARCPCGSGLRYKACCGRISAPPLPAPRESDTDSLLDQVEAMLAQGDASTAQRLLKIAAEDPQVSRARLVAGARLELALDNAHAAYDLLQRAADRGVDAEIGFMLEECCARLAQPERHASLWRAIRQLCLRSLSRSQRSPPLEPSIAIALGANASADVRRNALALREVLATTSTQGAVMLTTLASPVPCSTLVVADAGDMDWPEGAASPRRVIVRLRRDDPELLLRSLARLELRWPDAALQFTLPHAGILDDASGLGVVEYPWVDADLFELPHAQNTSPLRVGIQGAASPDQLHPDDGSFYRRLLAEGYGAGLPSVPVLANALRNDPLANRVVWADEVPMASLDVVIARGEPRRPGWADARVLEAMAAARSVIVFGSSLGAREWIAHGATGFVVHSADDARARIAQLAASPALRNDIGEAARRIARAIVREQVDRVQRFYFDVSVNV
jgi:tetratricopeptide (TPR) repeat protein